MGCHKRNTYISAGRIVPGPTGETGGNEPRTVDGANRLLSILGEGEVGFLDGFPYRKSTGFGAFAATADLGILDLIPGGEKVFGEQFGLSDTPAADRTTDSSDDMQRFVNYVVNTNSDGCAPGRYNVSRTIIVNSPYGTDIGVRDGFSLQIGKGHFHGPSAGGPSSGLNYIGPAGPGSAPHEVTPILAVHNCRDYQINAVVGQDHDFAVAGIGGIRFTASDNTQLGDFQTDWLIGSSLERGAIVGLRDFDGNRHDVWERAEVHVLNFSQTRHGFYASSQTTDGADIWSATFPAYNAGGNGPLFYRDDPTLTSNGTIEMDIIGNITWHKIEVAQVDYNPDPDTAVFAWRNGTVRVNNWAFEVTDVMCFNKQTGSIGRNPANISNGSSSGDAKNVNDVAANFDSYVKLEGNSWSGHIEYGAHGITANDNTMRVEVDAVTGDIVEEWVFRPNTGSVAGNVHEVNTGFQNVDTSDYLPGLSRFRLPYQPNSQPRNFNSNNLGNNAATPVTRSNIMGDNHLLPADERHDWEIQVMRAANDTIHSIIKLSVIDFSGVVSLLSDTVGGGDVTISLTPGTPAGEYNFDATETSNGNQKNLFGHFIKSVSRIDTPETTVKIGNF